MDLITGNEYTFVINKEMDIKQKFTYLKTNVTANDVLFAFRSQVTFEEYLITATQLRDLLGIKFRPTNNLRQSGVVDVVDETILFEFE